MWRAKQSSILWDRLQISVDKLGWLGGTVHNDIQTFNYIPKTTPWYYLFTDTKKNQTKSCITLLAFSDSISRSYIFQPRYLDKSSTRESEGNMDNTSMVRTPLENYKNIGFLCNTGPDSLKITKLPIQHPMLGHHRPAIERHLNGVSLAGRWWPADSGIWILPPLIKLKKNNNNNKKKNVVEVGPPLTKMSGSAHGMDHYFFTLWNAWNLFRQGMTVISYFSVFPHDKDMIKRGTCIKGLKWPLFSQKLKVAYHENHLIGLLEE